MRVLCIGCGCEGHLIAEAAGIRIPGPVDNFAVRDKFSSIESLFNGKLFDAIKNREYEECVPEEEEGECLYLKDKYYSLLNGSYKIFHNDPLTEEYNIEINKRINNFKENYLKNDVYYFYTFCNYFNISKKQIIDLKNIHLC